MVVSARNLFFESTFLTASGPAGFEWKKIWTEKIFGRKNILNAFDSRKLFYNRSLKCLKEESGWIKGISYPGTPGNDSEFDDIPLRDSLKGFLRNPFNPFKGIPPGARSASGFLLTLSWKVQPKYKQIRRAKRAGFFGPICWNNLITQKMNKPGARSAPELRPASGSVGGLIPAPTK